MLMLFQLPSLRPTTDDEHARALEEQWIDSLDNANTVSLAQSTSGTSSSTLLQGIISGLFFPIIPFFFFRESQPAVFWDDGTDYEALGSVVLSCVFPTFQIRVNFSDDLCSKRMQMGLVVGFLVNMFFGMWIFLVSSV